LEWGCPSWSGTRMFASWPAVKRDSSIVKLAGKLLDESSTNFDTHSKSATYHHSVMKKQKKIGTKNSNFSTHDTQENST